MDGGSSSGGDYGMSGQMVLTQSLTRTMAHIGVDGGTSHGRIPADDTRGMTDNDGLVASRAQSADGELRE